jgi:hypothetical protein
VWQGEERQVFKRLHCDGDFRRVHVQSDAFGRANLSDEFVSFERANDD